MIIGNLFQQLYTLVDSIVVGQFVGKNALAAVSSAFTVMVFVTSIIIGLCMGTAIVFLQFFGAGDIDKLKRAITISFIFAFLYNGMSSLLRALGDSKTPLYFLELSALVNIVLDLVLVLQFGMGVKGVIRKILA